VVHPQYGECSPRIDVTTFTSAAPH